MNDINLPQVKSTSSTKKINQKVDLVGKSNHRLSQTGKAILGKDIMESEKVKKINPYMGLNIPDGENKRTITENYLKAHSNHIYVVEEAEPPRDFAHSMFHPLPNDIDFKRIIYNVMNAL